MDSSVNDDCLVTDGTSKAKKLKQELSFQSLSSIETQHNVSVKKRKLTSPEECRISKILKATAKENSLKNKVNNNIKKKDISMNDELNNIEDDKEWIERSGVNEANEDKSSNLKSNKKHNKKSTKKSLSKSKKDENKSLIVSSTLTKFLKKVDKETEKKQTKSSNTGKTDRTEWTIEDINNCSDEESKKNNKTKSYLLNDSNMTEDEAASKNKLDITIVSDYDTTIVSSENEDSTNKRSNDEEIMIVDEVKSPLTPAMTKNKILTLKRLEKKKESKKRQEEREKRRMERRKEQEDQRKEKEQKRRAEKEQKRKEKELKEHKRQKEMEQKQKEKEAKEQERRKREEAKEEEKKKKEEEKLEAERKMQKAVSNFASFFVPKKHETKSVEEENNTNISRFMPFEVKSDMRIAPICRRNLNKHEKLMLDEMCNKNDARKCDLYLSEIKTNRIIIHKSKKTWPLEAKDVIILEQEDTCGDFVIPSTLIMENFRPKLLQFYENRRPPYWGTWRKRSHTITPRRPFSKDLRWFDYEVDSDEEWEEEPGESLHGSEDEKDEENADDNEYDVDNEFMVPHGYLSDEEGQDDDEELRKLKAAVQKFRLKFLGEEFEAERKAKTQKLKPLVVDTTWMKDYDSFPVNFVPKCTKFVTMLHAWCTQTSIELKRIAATNEYAEPEGSQSSGRKTKVPEEALPDLMRLIHGSIYSRKFLAKEFVTFWNKKEQHANGDKRVTKASIQDKIREIAVWIPCPDHGEMHLKTCWYVCQDIRDKYLPENEKLPLPNRWKYNLTRKRKDEIQKKPVKIVENVEKDKKNVPLITQFTKKITQEEMKQQLVPKPAQLSNSKDDVQQKPPKRALLTTISRKVT